MISPRDFIGAVDPDFVAGRTTQLSLGTTEALITRAIWEHRLAEVAAALEALGPHELSSDARALVAASTSCCRTIAAHNRAETERLIRIFGSAGVRAVDGTTATQIRSVELLVDGDDAERALELALADGYTRPGDSSGVTPSGVALVRRDRHDVRLLLKRRRSVGARVVGRTKALGRRVLRSPSVDDQGPYVATPTDLVGPLFDVLEVRSTDTVMDLGCGDGRMLVEVARAVGCRCRGIEQDERLIELGRLRAVEESVEHLVTLEIGDISDARLDGVSVVVVFLPVARVADRLRMLLAQLDPGARILAHEQHRIEAVPPPDRVVPVIGTSSLTVAHLWFVT